MSEFYLDERLGETRAALTSGERLLEMHIQRDGDGPAAGARVQAVLTKKLGRRGIARCDGIELLLEPWPVGATEGESHMVEITRAAWPERGRPRLAKARPARPPARPAEDIAVRLQKRGATHMLSWPDWLEEQWLDSFQQALTGSVPFAGGSLQFAPTPAFVAVDVDGEAARATDALLMLGRVIAQWQLGGNIVVDLPHLGKAARKTATDAFDAAMADAPDIRFERTAINGFGLLQIVCARRGPSILERAWYDPAGTEGIECLQEIARSPDTGPIRMHPSRAARDWLQVRPHLLQELSARTHRPLDSKTFPLLTV